MAVAQMSVSQIPSGQLPVSQMPIGQMFVCQMSFNPIPVSLVSVDQISVGEMSVNKKSVGQMYVTQMSVSQMSVHQMPDGQMFFDKRTRRHSLFNDGSARETISLVLPKMFLLCLLLFTYTSFNRRNDSCATNIGANDISPTNVGNTLRFSHYRLVSVRES
jgi:hypothetical protein